MSFHRAHTSPAPLSSSSPVGRRELRLGAAAGPWLTGTQRSTRCSTALSLDRTHTASCASADGTWSRSSCCTTGSCRTRRRPSSFSCVRDLHPSPLPLSLQSPHHAPLLFKGTIRDFSWYLGTFPFETTPPKIHKFRLFWMLVQEAEFSEVATSLCSDRSHGVGSHHHHHHIPITPFPPSQFQGRFGAGV